MSHADHNQPDAERQPAFAADGPPRPAESPHGAVIARLMFTPIDITFLVYFRIAFGVLMLWLGWQYYDYGMIDRYFITPKYHLTYYGFEWVKPWPAIEALGLSRAEMMYCHFIAMGVMAACIALGLFYRVSAFLFGVGFLYIFLLERARYMNHYYLAILISFLLACIPAHRAFSLDVLRKPALRSSTVPAWTLRILQFQILVVYVFAGVAKCNWDWIQGAPMGDFLVIAHYRLAPSLRGLLLHPWTALVMSWGGLLLDLIVLPLLLWKRTRLIALAAATAFHLLNMQLFHIDIFPWFMLAASFLFFFPDRLPWGNRGVANFGTEPFAVRETGPLSRGQRLTFAALAAYAAVQILLPLRQFAYAGNPNWTYNAHEFSWRMLAASKQIDLRNPPQFIVRARKNGRLIEAPVVRNRKHPEFDRLTWREHWRYYKIAINPEFILQFAHIQAKRLRARGYKDVEIRANIPVSLNSRPARPLIDPTVDLAKEPRRFLTSYPWILHLDTPLPSFKQRRERQKADIRRLQLLQAGRRKTLRKARNVAANEKPP